ncbi:MAG: type II secretion system protein [Phycisphaerae bacterium]|nr:prepilin-type N-terminal cleavage/methylation domain-containing protein [Tepidisphaeraceae bacterium]
MTTARAVFNARRRGGFTLVEILTAVAILAVLMGLSVLGYRHLSAGSKKRSTETAMKALQSLMVENGVDMLKTDIAAYGNASTKLAVPGVLPDDAKAKLADDKVRRTRVALRLLTGVPANEKHLADLPREMRIDLGGKTLNENRLADPNPGLPMPVVDGWGNPILYVPGVGATGIKDAPDPLLSPDKTTVGTVEVGRSYWMSAGPDGDYSTGEDNIYSWGQ